MDKYKGLPIYKMTIEDGTLGMTAVALTDNPAIEVDWFAFSKEERIKCQILDDGKQHKILTCICRADFPIYRRNGKDEFYVEFPKETIKLMAQKFLRNGFQGQINLEHVENAFIEGFELEQLFIKDVENGVNPKGFEKIEDGSLFGIYKVENPELWKAIEDGLFTSVSLEGTFAVKEQEINTIEDLLKYLQSK